MRQRGKGWRKEGGKEGGVEAERKRMEEGGRKGGRG